MAVSVENELSTEADLAAESKVVLSKESTPVPVIDLDWFDLNTHFFSWVQFLEPFGSQFPEPVFRLRQVPVFSVKKMKEIHFKLNVVNPQNREPLNFVLFNSNEDQRQMLTSLTREYDICFKIKKDNFTYNQRFQFVIDDITTLSV
jgi:single-stranded DNA-specific DHH superfamily exonuclease